MMTEESIVIEREGTEVRITHPERVVFPTAGITKRDLIDYYSQVSDRILSQTRGRAMVMHRFPRGVGQEGFYQKRAPENAPDYVRTKELPSPTNEGPIEYVIGDNLATILWLVNLGAFEMNPWFSLAESPEEPTHVVVDLDPMGGDFADVCRAALLVRDVLEARGFRPNAKTSGKSGIHVTAQLESGYTFPRVRELLAEVGRELDAKNPETFALEERIGTRKGLIYFDSNQNGYGSTIAAAYSVRPSPTATISMPLSWAEIEQIPAPEQFTLQSEMHRRLHNSKAY
jgi:bifunctional non-homologous end joining protein LigD